MTQCDGTAASWEVVSAPCVSSGFRIYGLTKYYISMCLVQIADPQEGVTDSLNKRRVHLGKWNLVHFKILSTCDWISVWSLGRCSVSIGRWVMPFIQTVWRAAMSCSATVFTVHTVHLRNQNAPSFSSNLILGMSCKPVTTFSLSGS